jgi:stress response protein YsnF
MSEDLRIPIVEEQAHVTRATAEIERVHVRTVPEEETVLVRNQTRVEVDHKKL